MNQYFKSWKDRWHWVILQTFDFHLLMALHNPEVSRLHRILIAIWLINPSILWTIRPFFSRISLLSGPKTLLSPTSPSALSHTDSYHHTSSTPLSAQTTLQAAPCSPIPRTPPPGAFFRGFSPGLLAAAQLWASIAAAATGAPGVLPCPSPFFQKFAGQGERDDTSRKDPSRRCTSVADRELSL